MGKSPPVATCVTRRIQSRSFRRRRATGPGGSGLYGVGRLADNSVLRARAGAPLHEVRAFARTQREREDRRSARMVGGKVAGRRSTRAVGSVVGDGRVVRRQPRVLEALDVGYSRENLVVVKAELVVRPDATPGERLMAARSSTERLGSIPSVTGSHTSRRTVSSAVWTPGRSRCRFGASSRPHAPTHPAVSTRSVRTTSG